MASINDVEVLHQGKKYFSSAQVHVRVIIVHHKKLGVVEVLCHDMGSQTDKLRVYLNYKVLLTLIEKDKVNSRMHKITRKASKSHVDLEETVAQSQALNEVIYDFVISRLRPSFGVLQFSLLTRDKADFANVGYGNEKLVVDKPTLLQEYKYELPHDTSASAADEHSEEEDKALREGVEAMVTEAHADHEVIVSEEQGSPPPIHHPLQTSTEKEKKGQLRRRATESRSSFSKGLGALTSSLTRSLSVVTGSSVNPAHRPHAPPVIDTTKPIQIPAANPSPLLHHTPQRGTRSRPTSASITPKAKPHHSKEKEKSKMMSMRFTSGKTELEGNGAAQSRRVFCAGLGFNSGVTYGTEGHDTYGEWADGDVQQDDANDDMYVEPIKELEEEEGSERRRARQRACDAANRDLREARSFAKNLAAAKGNTATSGSNAASTSSAASFGESVKLLFGLNSWQGHANRLNSYRDTGGKNVAFGPITSDPSSEQASVSKGAQVGEEQEEEEEEEDTFAQNDAPAEQAPDVSTKPQRRTSVAEKVMQPMRRMLEAVTRRSVSTVVPSN